MLSDHRYDTSQRLLQDVVTLSLGIGLLQVKPLKKLLPVTSTSNIIQRRFYNPKNTIILLIQAIFHIYSIRIITAYVFYKTKKSIHIDFANTILSQNLIRLRMKDCILMISLMHQCTILLSSYLGPPYMESKCDYSVI